MPKLLQINVTANWGSTGKIAEQIGLCAQSHGWESYIAYGRMMNPSKNKLIKIGNQLDVYEHFAEDRFLDNEGLASRNATKAFLKKVDAIAPDVVHLHNIHDHYLNYKLLFQYLAEKDIPVIWTQHDQWATTGHCMYTPTDCEKWKNKCHACEMTNMFSLDRSSRNHERKKKLFSMIPRMSIVTVSEWLRDMICMSHLGTNNITVIHNGIDTNVFKPSKTIDKQKYGIPENKKIILGVAAVWDQRKGFNDYIRLSKLLSKDCIIVLVGVSSDQISKLPSNIIGVERTQNQEELAQLYSMADVLLSLSSAETFGMTMAEAYSCGTPCIVYNNTAQPEIVTLDTGYVVETGDVQAVYNAVVVMLEGNFKEMKTSICRQLAVEYYDKKKCYEAYISLCNSLLGGGKFLVIIYFATGCNPDVAERRVAA